MLGICLKEGVLAIGEVWQFGLGMLLDDDHHFVGVALGVGLGLGQPLLEGMALFVGLGHRHRLFNYKNACIAYHSYILLTPPRPPTLYPHPPPQ